MKNEEKQAYFQELYDAAIANGLCRNQKEFAELLNISETSVSKALKGNYNYLTDRLLKKTANIMDNRINLNNSSRIDGGNVVSGEQKNFASPQGDFSALLAEMKSQREMYQQQTDRLLTIIEQLTKNNQNTNN